MKISTILIILSAFQIALSQTSIVPDQRMTMEGLKWGYKNAATGEKVTKAIYDAAYEFKNSNIAIAKKGDKLGYVNIQGKEITPFKYEKAEDFVNGFAKVQIGNLLGFIDSTGKEITEIKFVRLRNFQEGYATASLEEEGRTGFIDSKGRMFSRFNYDNAGSYNEGYAWVELRGKVGFLNKLGDEVIKPQYDLVTDYKNGVSIVAKKLSFGLLDKMGREVIAINYNSIKRYAPDSSLFLVQNKQGKYGVYNKSGKVLIPEYFAKIDQFQNYNGKFLAPVYRVPGEIFIYIDETGKCFEFDGKVCPEE